MGFWLRKQGGFHCLRAPHRTGLRGSLGDQPQSAVEDWEHLLCDPFPALRAVTMGNFPHFLVPQSPHQEHEKGIITVWELL